MISVIVPAFGERATIGRCLRSLEAQTGTAAAAFEVIVVASATDGTADLVRAEFPRVRLITSAARLWPGDARNAGVREASGDILAFTDADCAVDPQWVARLFDAHARLRRPVIGGAIALGDPGGPVDWAFYFCSFGAWMPGTPAGEVPDIPTCCLSMTRRAFDRFGPFLEGTYSSDSAFHLHAARDGVRPWFEPSIVVAHVNHPTLTAFLLGRFVRGRAFAQVRSKTQAFSHRRCVCYAALAPALPPLLAGRLLNRVWRRREVRRRLVVSLPLVVLGYAAWAWGEAAGYLDTYRTPEAA